MICPHCIAAGTAALVAAYPIAKHTLSFVRYGHNRKHSTQAKKDS